MAKYVPWTLYEFSMLTPYDIPCALKVYLHLYLLSPPIQWTILLIDEYWILSALLYFQLLSHKRDVCHDHIHEIHAEKNLLLLFATYISILGILFLSQVIPSSEFATHFKLIKVTLTLLQTGHFTVLGSSIAITWIIKCQLKFITFTTTIFHQNCPRLVPAIDDWFWLKIITLLTITPNLLCLTKNSIVY